MLTLFYSPGACSQAPHIVLHETGLPFQAIAAPTRTKRLPDGSDYLALNPLGYVPLLQLADGEKLTEGLAILLYLADQAPARHLAPPEGSMARYRLLSWLTFLTTELHKGGFGPLFNAAANAEFKAAMKTRLAGRLAWVESQLTDGAWLTGEHYTVADALLFTITNWAQPTGVPLDDLPKLRALRERIAARPAVQAALAAERPAA